MPSTRTSACPDAAVIRGGIRSLRACSSLFRVTATDWAKPGRGVTVCLCGRNPSRRISISWGTVIRLSVWLARPRDSPSTSSSASGGRASTFTSPSCGARRRDSSRVLPGGDLDGERRVLVTRLRHLDRERTAGSHDQLDRRLPTPLPVHRDRRARRLAGEDEHRVGGNQRHRRHPERLAGHHREAPRRGLEGLHREARRPAPGADRDGQGRGAQGPAVDPDRRARRCRLEGDRGAVGHELDVEPLLGAPSLDLEGRLERDVSLGADEDRPLPRRDRDRGERRRAHRLAVHRDLGAGHLPGVHEQETGQALEGELQLLPGRRGDLDRRLEAVVPLLLGHEGVRAGSHQEPRAEGDRGWKALEGHPVGLGLDRHVDGARGGEEGQQERDEPHEGRDQEPGGAAPGPARSARPRRFRG